MCQCEILQAYNLYKLRTVQYKLHLTITCIFHSHQSNREFLLLPCYFLYPNTWVSKTQHFMYLLLTLVILLLPESILVICFINWHTDCLPFTTYSLDMKGLSGIGSSGSHWDDPELFVMKYFKNPELVIVYLL